MKKLLFLLATAGWAQGSAPPPDPEAARGFRALAAEDAEWRRIEGLPDGAFYHPLSSEPGKATEFLVRLPRGYEVPPHLHTHPETLVVVEGRLHVLVRGAERSYGPGSYLVHPGGLVHRVRTGRWRGCTFYARVDGPFDLIKAP